MSWEQLDADALALLDESDQYKDAKRRLLRAGAHYVEITGRRAPIWLGRIHHGVLWELAYRQGYAEGQLGYVLGLWRECNRAEYGGTR